MGLFATLSYAFTNKCPDSLRFFCKMLFKNSSVDEKPNALAFWQWLALCKVRSSEARCVSPAYIIAVRNWRVLARSQSGNSELCGIISSGCWTEI